MKEQLLNEVTELHDVLRKLDLVWNDLDWSIVPDAVTEQYPFHMDLKQMTESVKIWRDSISNS
ncbi:hypothetical protein [Paenibacillus sp. FSL H7-0714]|uniref:hypothetical protein n=1 Tax=Paenibacillus sp. FSL H7-0714 TaxID=2954735 RepID=UPI0030F9659D